MNDIICPHCKKVFKVDEAGFADILKQVHDHVFDKELHERLELAEKEKENAVKLAESNLKNTLQEELTKKDKELAELRAENDRNLAEKLAKKESELAEIKSKLDKADVEKKLSVTEAVKNIDSDFTKKYSFIPWSDVARMRDKLIHEYFGVDIELVWAVVKKDLPQLKEDIQKIQNNK